MKGWFQILYAKACGKWLMSRNYFKFEKKISIKIKNILFMCLFQFPKLCSGSQQWTYFTFYCDTRSEILSRLEQVLLLDLPLSHQKAVEQIMWKSVFYFVIEVFRQELAEFDDEHVRQQLLAVIDNVSSSTHIHYLYVGLCLFSVVSCCIDWLVRIVPWHWQLPA